VVQQGKGLLGYALCTDGELDFVSQFDGPGQGSVQLYGQCLEEGDASEFSGKNWPFWHTGGALYTFQNIN